MTESLIAAFVVGSFIVGPIGLVIGRPRFPARLRRRFWIVDRKTGQTIRRFRSFGRAADAFQAGFVFPVGRYDLEKR